ncbi:hypothetical protein G5V58_08195 [Nocardioides anomalus]|uniref:C1q domain-containing protein n=1 Tax=Nocardioides anomalus TaxID=2712223 RepID=A0A6G6WCE4_9ACTN|nr:hypothetical protein [Nocardioides anomalus]QIG42765.1 hypothetical protein G5V58_08195 [Nocardioides anomalus]
MTRTRVAVAVAVALVIGVLLGSGVAPAAASGLTKKAVKKLAASVVEKQAPGLSVARASTADRAATALDAQAVGGLPASALQTPVFQYRLPTTTTPTANLNYVFPGLPAGRYVVSYSASFDVSSNVTALFCQLSSDSGATRLAFSAVEGGTAYTISCSGSTALEVAAGSTLRFRAEGNGSTIRSVPSPQTPNTVTFTRVDTITSAAAVSAP